MKKFFVLIFVLTLIVILFICGKTFVTNSDIEAEADLISLSVTSINETTNITLLPDQDEYSVTVDSDIYGVNVSIEKIEGTDVFIDGIKYDEAKCLVELSQEYDDYANYSKEVEIKLKSDIEKIYTLNIVREDLTDIYDLFETKTYTDNETGLELPYLIYVPTNYDKTKQYPVVFALHGSGQRTQSTDMILKRYKMATVWAKDSEEGVNECIVIAPHLNSTDPIVNWTSLQAYREGLAEDAFEIDEYSIAAYNMLMEVTKQYSVNKDKFYMTGLSSGGFGTYAIASVYPNTFAAIVPICGGLDPESAKHIKDIPKWIFHAKNDPSVNIDEYLYPTINSIEEVGGVYCLTIYDEDKVFYPSSHFSWSPAYNDEEMRTWLFDQSKQ
ncbi:hypothetical protein AN639_02530 [Candidatus Epulonipiscium fishelsonii]|uniref:Uncharacterized protein n=1 Tax=Candidatus Epulonipiscium fishelsonii TaxID=77094 RepID=A0ACC8XBE6_9FIRM|nr:hypothetical protein AN396_07770 [Epulopiscium sp. SCG-B11WGA-EpuloA1]ONI42003.1 hypothetical protein AN639_02530 [Epulopiscium sp. SCG-B05WGA-EpuloA1]